MTALHRAAALCYNYCLMKRLVASVPVALLFAAVAALGCFRLIDTDLWLYLRVGERICRLFELPRFDSFSYSATGRPWVDVHWLAQAALWIAWRAGGAAGLCLLRLALVTSIFAGLYRACRRDAPPPLVCGVLALALLVAQDGFLMKPQLFALLLAAVFVASLDRHGTTPWILVPLQALWVNMHPSFPLGPLLVLLYWADGRLAPRGERRRHAALFAACLLACFATPYGPAVLVQPWRQVGTPLFGETVIPWTPPSAAFPSPSSFFFFKIAAAATAAAFLLNAFRIRPAHLAIAVLFAALSLKSRRHLPLFAVLVAPGLAYNLGCLWTRLRRRAPRLSFLLAGVWTAALAAALVALSRDAVTGGLYFRQRSLKRFGLGKSEIAYPDEALAFLDAAGAGGNLFCNYEIGSYVASVQHPRRAIFIDGRNLVYGESLLRRYLDAMGDLRSLDALADEYGVEALLFTHTSRDVKALLPALWRSPRWRPVYADDRSVVFLPHGALPRFPRIDPSSCPLPGIPSRGPFPLAELRLGEFLFRVGERDRARGLFRDALARRPRLPEAHTFLGVMAAQDGDLAAAEGEFRVAAAMSRTYAEPRINLSEIFRLRGDFAGAVREARVALRIAPLNACAREALGLALLSSGDAAAARRELEEAARIDPRSADYQSNLGVLCEREGDEAGAAAAYGQARLLSPDSFAARFNLALLRERGGDVDGAILLLEEALLIDPSHGSARRKLAALEARRAGRGEQIPASHVPSNGQN